MTTIPQERYAALTSIHGDRLGLGGVKLPAPGTAAGKTARKLLLEYLTGRFLKGIRLGTYAGADYIMGSIDQHATLTDDFLGPVLSTANWGVEHGSDGSAVNPAIAAALNGSVRLTTGASATATMAVNGSQLDSALNWEATENGLRAEFRIGNASSVANLSLFFGFTNEKGTLQMPLNGAAADAIVANAADAVGFLYDTANATQTFFGVGSKASAVAKEAFTEASAAAPGGAGLFSVYRVEVDLAGNASFYIDGIQVGSILLNAVTPGTPLTPVIAAFSRAAASKTIDCDYVLVQQIRF